MKLSNLKSHKLSPRFIIGIDEAGRGPLAGPVVVGAVKISRRGMKMLSGIRDSKKLSAKKREEWFLFLTNHPKIECTAAIISPRVIDRINIAQATNRGVRRVYVALAAGGNVFAKLDGSLVLAPQIPHEVIIKGDEKVPVIAAASIIAKVTRDRIMLRLHKRYPVYRFDIHKGYGTKLHRDMIQKFGRSDVHRKSFRFETV